MYFGYLSVSFCTCLDNFAIAKYSPMTFTNVLESQIKFLICVESKADSGTPTVFNNADN